MAKLRLIYDQFRTKLGPNKNQINPTKPNGCHIEVTQPCLIFLLTKLSDFLFLGHMGGEKIAFEVE